MKLLYSALLGLSLLAAPSIRGMDAATKATAKKLFSRVMTGAHWGLTTLPFWEKSYKFGKAYWNGDEMVAQRCDAPADIQAFVRSELKKSGIERADSISVKQLNHAATWSAIFDKAIAISTQRFGPKISGL